MYGALGKEKEVAMDRRQFIKKSGLGALTLGLAGSTAAHAVSGKAARKAIEWSIKRKNWKSLGPLDLIPQLNQGQQWANESLIKYGTVEPPNSGKRSMRSACMPAESCAHHYAMTGGPATLKALKAAVKTFRKYRHEARGRSVPFADISKLGDKPTIEYEMISCHVGRNMRGMRAAAHVLRDEQLLHEVAEELNWWIDNPLAFNHEKHFFDARIFVDEKGKTIGSERKYTMNMGGSLACAMWMVGNDLGDRRLKDYAEDQILNGIAPHQLDNGYFPYNIGHKYELVDGIALDSNYYHALTLQVISPLLAYKEWSSNPKFAEMMRRGAQYLRRLTFDNGVVKHPRHIDVIRARKLNFLPKSPWGITVDSALVHARIYKYLGEEEALPQLSKNLRWLHWNSPSCVPFLPSVCEGGFSHNFRQVMLMAWEGIHLRQKGIRDVEVVFCRVKTFGGNRTNCWPSIKAHKA